ncbi:MAG: hypothetical protein JW915_24705 [Chitinispirillaceae bacterium]|nr:hypothetical protein [Chitinispirillaceae bacterium]
MSFSKLLLFKLFLICIVLTSFSTEVHTVGVGFTRDAAHRNALKHALERNIKAFISERAYMQNEQLINREFMDDVSRYVQNSNIISTNESFNCFQVEATADIDNLTLKEHLTTHGLTVKSISKPVIIMLVDEYHDNNKMSEQTACLTLKQVLVKNGYTILDLKQETVLSADISSSGITKITDMAYLGFENGADLIIKGMVNTGKATPVDIYGKKQLTVPVQMNVEIIRTDNARIIASNTISIRKNATNEFSALQFALKSAAEATGTKIVAKLDAFSESEDYTERHFELIIDGIDYSQAERLEFDIKKLSCIKEVAFRYLERKRAVFGICMNGTLTELRNEISSGKIHGLAIESLTRGKIFAVYGNDSLHTVSLSADSDVEISSFNIETLYSSKRRHYVTHPAGNFTLNCSVPVSDVRLSLSLPELLGQPFEISINHFDPGENKVDLFIVPAYEKLVNIVQTRIIQAQLELQYSLAQTVLNRSLTIPVTIYGINGMNWEHPDAVSSFITNDDPVVRSFARQAIQGVPSGSKYNQDLVNAIAVHAAICKYGIQYVKDPLPNSEKVVDMVQYPAQTLFHRTGDCDDLSVLYCSLLSSLGIPVALLSYDDHIFFMFNTGIYEKNRLGLSSDTTMTIIHDKKLWIPIEATDMHTSFVKNWYTTARKFHDAVNAGRKVQIIDIQEAWKCYPPVSLFAEKFDISLKPVEKEVEIQLQNLRDVTTKQYKKEIASLKSLKKKDIGDPAVVKNKVGLLYVRSGDYQKALQFFKQAYNINKSPKMLSNYAGTLLLSGKEKEALKIFDKIYKEDDSGAIAVNRALCKYIVSGDTSASQNFYDCLLEAVSVIQTNENLSEILGFDITSQDSLRGSSREQTCEASKLDISIVRQNIKAAIDAIKQQHTISGVTTESSSGTRITGTTTETSTGTTADNMKQKVSPFGGLRGATIEDFIRLIDLLYWFDF